MTFSIHCNILLNIKDKMLTIDAIEPEISTKLKWQRVCFDI